MPWIGNMDVPDHMIKGMTVGSDDRGDYLIVTVCRQIWQDYHDVTILGATRMEYKPELVTVSHDYEIRDPRQLKELLAVGGTPSFKKDAADALDW